MDLFSLTKISVIVANLARKVRFMPCFGQAGKWFQKPRFFFVTKIHMMAISSLQNSSEVLMGFILDVIVTQQKRFTHVSAYFFYVYNFSKINEMFVFLRIFRNKCAISHKTSHF